jgi:hypothetical protein
MTKTKLEKFKEELKALLERHNASFVIDADFWGSGGAENPRIGIEVVDYEKKTTRGQPTIESFTFGDQVSASDI